MIFFCFAGLCPAWQNGFPVFKHPCRCKQPSGSEYQTGSSGINFVLFFKRIRTSSHVVSADSINADFRDTIQPGSWPTNLKMTDDHGLFHSLNFMSS